MKAIIPVAGAGTRLRPHTYTQPKPLIPVAGKAIISFIIDKLIDVGVDDFVFIIGYLGEDDFGDIMYFIRIIPPVRIDFADGFYTRFLTDQYKRSGPIGMTGGIIFFFLGGRLRQDGVVFFCPAFGHNVPGGPFVRENRIGRIVDKIYRIVIHFDDFGVGGNSDP